MVGASTTMTAVTGAAVKLGLIAASTTSGATATARTPNSANSPACGISAATAPA
jgi:hypothetical protein